MFLQITLHQLPYGGSNTSECPAQQNGPAVFALILDKAESYFYPIFALAAAAGAFLGFTYNYFAPMLAGTYPAVRFPPIADT